MDEEYDVIVLGTGIKECVLSMMMSERRHRVLHMDKHKYYGGEGRALHPLQDLYSWFNSPTYKAEEMGRGRDWIVDLIPKFLMTNDEMTKLLTYYKVTDYVEFKSVKSSYVYKSDGTINKIPINEEEMNAGVVYMPNVNGLLELLKFCNDFDAMNPDTYAGIDLRKTTMKDVYEKFGIDAYTVAATALPIDEDYLSSLFVKSVSKIKPYISRFTPYGRSQYTYPLYGMGELPQGFARVSAVYGVFYMLNKPIEEIVYDENGKVCGVKSGGKIAKCKAVVCDQSYAPDKVKKVGEVVCAICILNHPVPNTEDSDSCMIIIPQNQVGRKSDIYIAAVSQAHQVCAKGFYLAYVSTTVETFAPESELKPGLDLLGPITQKFIFTRNIYEPTEDGSKSKVYITSSYDATTHFETACTNILEIFKRMTGEPFDFNKKTSEDDPKHILL